MSPKTGTVRSEPCAVTESHWSMRGSDFIVPLKQRQPTDPERKPSEGPAAVRACLWRASCQDKFLIMCEYAMHDSTF